MSSAGTSGLVAAPTGRAPRPPWRSGDRARGVTRPAGRRAARPRPVDDQPVRPLLDVDAGPAQLARQRHDAIRLLDPQLGRDRRTRSRPSAQAAATASAGISSIARSASSPATRVPRSAPTRDAHARPPARPWRRPAGVISRSAPIAREHVQRAGAGRVEADVLDRDVAARHRSAPRRSGRRPTTDRRGREARGAQPAVPTVRVDGDRAGAGVDGDRRAQEAQHALGVIARAGRLAELGAPLAPAAPPAPARS